MAVLSQAMYAARELAMTRMEEEADQLGADGVVGVRLDIGRYEWGEHMAEFIAIGTAVKHHEGELHRAPNGRPFTSDLSGQDFWTLLASGHRPVGLVMGSCVYHVAHHGMMASMRQVGQNVEMPNFTQALYDARELAMERMQNEAEELQAEGHRRRAAPGALARLGLTRDRVLRRRNGDRPARSRNAGSPNRSPRSASTIDCLHPSSRLARGGPKARVAVSALESGQ